jgi:hypothetical protein
MSSSSSAMVVFLLNCDRIAYKDIRTSDTYCVMTYLNNEVQDVCKAAYPSEGTLVAMKQVSQLTNEGVVV